MKLNISYPLTGAQKCIEIDDDKKYSIFFDRRMGQEVEADGLGESYKGYIFKITGGNDKDGFSMKQGIIVKKRIRLLLSKGHKSYRPRRTGERKRKSVRGCIVGPDICALSLVLIKKGETPIEGLTNVQVPRRLGPKRLNRIRKLFGFDKKKDHVSLVKKAIIRRKFKTAAGKDRQKAPKIQRLVTPDRLRRKRIFKKIKKQHWETSKKEQEEYHKLIADHKHLLASRKKQSEAQKAQNETKTTEKKVEKKVVDKKVEKKVEKKTATTTTAPVKVAAPAPATKKVEKKAETKTGKK